MSDQDRIIVSGSTRWLVERDALRGERDDLKAERDRLRDECERLRVEQAMAYEALRRIPEWAGIVAEYWHKNQDCKVGKHLLAMAESSRNYSEIPSIVHNTLKALAPPAERNDKA